MPEIGIRELLEAGVHFGHQTRRWNPKMRRFIFGERGGIYFIDLLQTQELLERARNFAEDIADRGGTVLFVGTKKPARDAIKEHAEAAGMPYVNHRWLGGLLTNWQTISRRISRLHDLERYQAEGQLDLLPTKERMAAQADLLKLQANLGGVKDMQRVPEAMFVIDLKSEAIAVAEAQRLRIPIIGLVDTNCDPDGIAYVVPGNDDAMRSCGLISRAIGEVVSEGRGRFRAQEEKARAEAEEKARREAEEQARKEAEEQARREAEEAAARGDAAAEPGQQPVAPATPPQTQQTQRARRAPRPPAQPAGDPVVPGVPATAEQVQAATAGTAGEAGGRTPAEQQQAAGAAPPAAAAPTPEAPTQDATTPEAPTQDATTPEAPTPEAARPADEGEEGGGGLLKAVTDLAGGAAAAAGDLAGGAVGAAQDVASGATEAARDLAEGAQKAVKDVTGNGEEKSS